MNFFEYLILGGGCIGSSIANEMSLAGFQNVALVDHDFKCQSATAISGGMVRVFHEDFGHTILALKSFKRFQELLSLKKNLSGSLYFFNSSRIESYSKNLNYLNEQNYKFEVLKSSEGRKRFPEFNWESRWAIFEPDAFQLSPSQYVEQMQSQAERQGVLFFKNHNVRNICLRTPYYRLSGHQFEFHARTLILAGGSRMLKNIKNLNLGLDLQIKTLQYFNLVQQLEKRLPNYFDRESLEFGGCFALEKHLISSQNPKRINLKFDPLNLRIQMAEDLYAPQRQGYLGYISGHENLIVATGWGGTGFKFAPDIGKQIVENIKLKNTNRGQIYA